MGHAVLSPSSASRWLSCTPSARLERTFADRSNDAADEGSHAHAVAENELKRRFGKISVKEFRDRYAILKTSRFHSRELEGYVDEYCDYIEEQFNDAGPNAMIYFEVTLNLSTWVPEGFGTGDVVIVSDLIAKLIDLKYGKGVRVSAIGNKQLRLYGLGVIHHFGLIASFTELELHIYQPRIDNITTETVDVADLEVWAMNELKPKAALAFAGKGDFVAGDHCAFCRAAPTCRALAEENLRIAQKEFTPTETLKDSEIVEILNATARFRSWLNSVSHYALVEALRGKKWPGMKVVEGRSSRKWNSAETAENRLLSLGYREDEIHEPADLLSVAKIEKLIGKKKVPEMILELITKTRGRPSLVIEADKRPEFKPAEADFAEFAEIDDASDD